MPRPFTHAQSAENRAFLDILAETGNARLAAREIGRKPSTMHHRRGANAAFAQQWDAAVAAAHARFHLGGGRRGPEGVLRDAASIHSAAPQDERRKRRKLGSRLRGNDREGRGNDREGGGDDREGGGDDRSRLRTRGGEPVVVRTRNGKLQLRLAHKDKLTRTAEQVFLAALSASANVRLSAAAAGASVAAFYRRRRQNKAFAREMRLALEMGFERLEMAAIAATLAEHHDYDDWRQREPPPIPPMSASQALQLLYLHEKSVRQGWDLPHRRRRRGESDEIYRARLGAMWICEKQREAEDEALRRAARFEETGSWRHADEPAPLPLPPLELVTGWSKASGAPPHREGLALFGGWRIEDMERRLAERKKG
jgi:hypothetical protein